MYATAVFGVLDTRRRTLRIASAGHPPPLLIRNGEVRPVEVDTTMCLLWDELKHVPCVDVPLEHGDRLVFYTDGITDRVAKDGDMFEMDRLCRVLARVGHGHPEQIVAGLLAEIEAFAGSQEPDDDQTLLVVGID
jgi:sigma-B regulation protein RsbU (phosphoserine phosphatase)